jgi:hypothetical protein
MIIIITNKNIINYIINNIQHIIIIQNINNDVNMQKSMGDVLVMSTVYYTKEKKMKGFFVCQNVKI